MLPVNLSTLSLDTAPPVFMDLLALPRPLVLAIFALLPVDTRLRCVEVSRAWRALLADMSLWKSLELSTNSGLMRFTEALFRAAIAKAGGQLRELNVFGRGRAALSTATLVDALAANAATLELLDARFPTWYTPAEVERLLEAAPSSVCKLNADIDNVEQARRFLRNEPPFGRLRLTGLDVKCNGEIDSLESLEALCMDLIKHPSIRSVCIQHAALGTAATMRVLVNAAIASRMHTIGLFSCGCTHACVPELTRLVSTGAVQQMILHNLDVELFAAGPQTDQFCAAVRASASLKRLDLAHCGSNPYVTAVAAFINARCK